MLFKGEDMKKLQDYTEGEIIEMINKLNQPWDRLPAENDLQYRAFREFFCRLPATERSVIKAYDKYLVSQAKKPVGRANEQWYLWYNLFMWPERAKAYDGFMHEETMNYVKHEQYQQLIDFRRRQRDLAGMITDSASLMIERALQALKRIRAEDITPRMIPEYVKTAAQVAELAQNAEANAMALNEIVEKLGLEQEQEFEIVDMGDGVIQSFETDNDTRVLFELLDELDDDDGVNI